MECNICCDVKFKLLKNCCLFNICTKCYYKLKEKNCPHCGIFLFLEYNQEEYFSIQKEIINETISLHENRIQNKCYITFFVILIIMLFITSILFILKIINLNK